MTVASVSPTAECPQCGRAADRIHSHYQRCLQDLPLQGVTVNLQWRTRRFFCDNAGCSQRVFTERLPEVANKYSRKTQRLVMLKLRGVDSVCRFTTHRKTDFRKGERVGAGDHIVVWPKPPKPRTIDRKTYAELPDSLTVRECRVRIFQRGFRMRTLVIATTLVDSQAYSKEDLAQLYQARWNAELDLRSLKQTLQMDILRCRTPELVRKEIWTHILAYNLIRTIIAQAATKHGLQPRTISFKGTLQTLEAFQPVIAMQGCQDTLFRERLDQELLDAVVAHRVADRPNRYEPRRRKRHAKKYFTFIKPRHEAKRDMAKGIRDK